MGTAWVDTLSPPRGNASTDCFAALAGVMVQVQYDYEEVVPSVAGGGFGLDAEGPNATAPYEMVKYHRIVLVAVLVSRARRWSCFACCTQRTCRNLLCCPISCRFPD
jgi:hypothetical protein